jgi:outer membrane protein OmpA-like peptidoglycan-associated protein
MRKILFVLPLVFFAACQPPGPKLAGPSISATVHTLPTAGDIIFEGEKVGLSPVELKVNSINQLTENLSAANIVGEPVEQRIKFLSSNAVEVTLVFGHDYPKVAKALNLKKILVFDYGDEITFEFNKSDLKPEFKTLLSELSAVLKKSFSGIDIHVCGHSDSVGRRERNLELSLERAESVFKVLSESGVPKVSMKVQGFGSDYPLMSNDTEAGRAKNRRTEIILGQ